MPRRHHIYIPDEYEKYWDKLEEKTKGDYKVTVSYLVNKAVKKIYKAEEN